MSLNRITLKKSPELEFIFDKDSLNIINKSDPKTEGVYQYSDFIEFEYVKNKVNWFWTIFGSLFILLFNDINSEVIREKKKLHLTTTDKKFTIDLFDCEQLQIDKLLNNLKLKIN